MPCHAMSVSTLHCLTYVMTLAAPCLLDLYSIFYLFVGILTSRAKQDSIIDKGIGLSSLALFTPVKSSPLPQIPDT